MKKVNMGGGSNAASAIIMGCMRIAEKSPQEVCTLIEKSAELGIDTFDHADIYGGGASEEIFADALTRSSIKREDIILQSKCGIRSGYYDLSKDHIIESAEGILKRLHTDYLDVFLLHRPDTLMEPEEIAEAFDHLYESGKVRSFGVSNMNSMQIAYLQSILHQRLVANQLQFSAAHTGIVDQGINVNMHNDTGIDRDGSILEYCRMNRITIQTWSSLQYGFFEGTFLENEKYPELNKALKEFADKRDISMSAAAIAWILRHPANMQAVVGTTNIVRLEEIAKAAEVSMSRPEWYEIYRAAGNMLP